MPDARSETYNPNEIGIFHCFTRCVRRAFLCGFDELSGRSFDHRREWIRQRLLTLVEIFAIEVFAYAVMSNHIHTLLKTRPDIPKQWSDREVARRWWLLFPLRRRKDGAAEEPNEQEILALTASPAKIEILRERLSNLSWFNRCLNENIARASNREDKCTGRFWEGRFKSQRADDLAAILACAAYIDLNPIRAGIAVTPESSDFTSIQDRIRTESTKHPGATPLPAPSKVPLVSIEEITGNRLTTAEYISLVDLTGRQLKGKKGHIPAELKPILKRLKINPETWIDTSKEIRRRFPKVIGSAEVMRAAAKEAGRSWFWGVKAAAEVFAV